VGTVDKHTPASGSSLRTDRPSAGGRAVVYCSNCREVLDTGWEGGEGVEGEGEKSPPPSAGMHVCCADA